MLYGSLNNWKCASTYFSLHRSFARLYNSLPFFIPQEKRLLPLTRIQSMPFFILIWSTVLYEKICFILSEREEWTKKNTRLALVPVVSNTLSWRVSYGSRWCAHCNIEPVQPLNMLSILVDMCVHRPYNREKAIFSHPTSYSSLQFTLSVPFIFWCSGCLSFFAAVEWPPFQMAF